MAKGPMLARALGMTAIVAVALWLHWPSLDAGLGADDYLQRAMLDGEYPIARSPLDLYSFQRYPSETGRLMDGGVLPWWTPPDLRLSLLRPLASALLYLDHSVLGLTPSGQHVHSLLWLVLFVLAFHLLARRVLPEGAAWIATTLIAFDLSLVAPVAWICNRAPLISATFGALGLWAYHRYREEHWRPGAWLAPLGFGLSVAGGEYAICVLAFVVAWELSGARDALPLRAKGLALAFVPAALYALAYVMLRFGASGNVVYVGPLDSPRAFAEGALLRIPAMLTSEFLILPGEWVYFGMLIRAPLTLLAFVPLVAVALLIVAAARHAAPALRRRLLAWLLGLILGLLPLSGTIPSVRLLLVPSIGGALVLGAVLWSGIERVSSASERKRSITWLVAAGTVGLAVVHLLLSPRLTRFHTVQWRDGVAKIRAAFIEAPLDDTRVAGQEVFLLNAPGDLIPLIYPPWVRHVNGSPLPRRWRVLTSTLIPQKVVRVGEDTVDVAVVADGAMFGGTAHIFQNPRYPFHVGQKVKTPGLEAEVLEVRGWAPSRVRFRFEGNVDDPSRVFLRLEAGRLIRVEMPKLGEEMFLPAG